MNKLTLLSVTGIIVALTGAPVLADTYVENSTSVRKIYKGVSKTTGEITGHKITKTWTDSISIKSEADKGQFNTARVDLKFDGHNFTAKTFADSRNERPVDPVAIVSASKQKEYTVEVENFNLNQFSKEYYTGHDFTHTVSSGSK